MNKSDYYRPWEKVLEGSEVGDCSVGLIVFVWLWNHVNSFPIQNKKYMFKRSFKRTQQKKNENIVDFNSKNLDQLKTMQEISVW